MAASVGHEVSARRSIPEVTSSHGVQESLAEFDILPDSPVVGFLSDAGDAFDNLAVQLQSVSMASGIAPMESISLRADIEKLTLENEQLKKSALEASNSMKTHFERCTLRQEQLHKCHERDAIMIEEARQKTLKLQQEMETLNTCLQNTQKKFEDAIVEKFSLSEAKKALEVELNKVRSELVECQRKLEDSSFVNIQGMEDFQSICAEAQEVVQSKENTEESQETEEEKKLPEEAVEPEKNSLIEQLKAEIERLKAQLHEESQSTIEMTKSITELEDVLVKKESEMEELRSQLSAAKTEQEAYKKQLEKDCDDLLKQFSLDKASFNAEREKKIQNLNERLAHFEKLAHQGERDSEALKKLKASIFESETSHRTEVALLKQRLSKTETEIGRLNIEVTKLQEERDSWQIACQQATQQIMDLGATKEREAELALLQRDQASQLEAFKEEWKHEQAERMKWEKSYQDLLNTWQNFEREQPVIVNGQPQQQGDEERQAALNAANLERARLESLVVALNQEIADLQAQNRQLMNDARIHTPQQPLRRYVPDYRCPLCNEAFADQTVLIQHAGECNGEN